MDIKGKLNHFTREDLIEIAPELDIDDYTDFGVWYDALEETMLHKKFILEDEGKELDITYDKTWESGAYCYIKFSHGIVVTTKKNKKQSIVEIRIQYKAIK